MRGAGGSPPLARGTVLGGLCGGLLNGITPACAGNSLCSVHGTFILEDHPRLRGEQASRATLYIIMLGSPPLARGTVTMYMNYQRILRITPACAGNRC